MMSLLFKLFYSVVLLGIAGLAAREFWTVWFDARVYIGKFDVVSASGKDLERSDAFPKRIVAAQTILAQQLVDYQARRSADAPSDTTYAISGMAPLLPPPEALAGVDITIQDINVRQILTAVRRGFLTPNEVVGNVTEREGSVLAAVEWSHAPRLADGTHAPTKFLIPSRASEQEVASYIACSISWARAASIEKNLAAIPRAQFCDFAMGLDDLYALQEIASSPAGLSDEQTSLVRRRAATLRSHYGENAVFPDIYRLRADLLDLLPEKARSASELVDAQEDRVRYAMLSSELSALPEETKRMAALALARPAILLQDGKPKDASPNWAGLLDRHPSDIGAAAAATGLVIGSDGKPKATGFVVAPGVMMTANFVANAITPSNVDDTKDGATSTPTPHLCLGANAAECGTSLQIGRVLYDGTSDKLHIVLLELLDHDPILVPPIPIAETLPDANAAIGRYSYVIGYPFFDARMPSEFVQRLLGKIDGQKRLMPGRVLAFGQQKVGGLQTSNTVFTTDNSTSSGTGGGPLLDLMTGKVIGMSYAGWWQGERGKFAYSEPIPPKALDIIARRLRGEVDADGAEPKGLE